MGNPLPEALEIQSIGNHAHKDADMVHFAKVACTTVFRIPSRTHKTTWAERACTQLSNLLGIFTKRSSGGLIEHQTPS